MKHVYLPFLFFLPFVRYEDEQALCGGRDGLDVVKEILRLSPALLKPGGNR